MSEYAEKLRRSGRMLAVLAMAGLPLVAGAQAAESDADDVGADTTLVPEPSVMAPRASEALLLDVTQVGDHWVAVGLRGDILLSKDGQSWQQVLSPADSMLTRVRFVDDRHGWAIGYDGTILGSEDGGKTWSLLQFDAKWGRPYYDVLFFDAQNGLVSGANGTLKKTSDGGKTWTPVDSPVFGDSPNLYNLIKLGDGSLLIAGERGLLARSTDQGATWTQLKSPYTGSYFGAQPVGARGALIFGLRGHAFYASDITQAAVLSAQELAAMQAAALDAAGAIDKQNPVSEVAGWTHLASDDTEPLFGAAPAADGRIYLVGQNGRVMLADLAGGSLKRLTIGTDINMNAARANGDRLIVVGTSGVTEVSPK